jgi:hypothetical protein
MMAPPRRCQSIKCPYPRTGTGVRVWSLLEGGVYPRARRSLLEGTFEWAALVGCGGHHSVGRAPCVCLSEMRLAWVFLQVLSGIPLVVLGDPQGCPRQGAKLYMSAGAGKV